MYTKIVATILLLTGLLAAPSMAHMNMVNPLPRGHKLFKESGYVDYDIMAPAQDICQGKPAGPISATLTAGQTINVQLEGPATHDGGHCQFAMSYDNGKTFVVLHTIEQRCMLDTLTYPITIPSTAPSSDHAIFAWTWINATGNREYYMNCADVKVIGQPDGYITGPKLLITSILGNPDVPEWGYTGKEDPVGPKMLASRPTITVSANGVAPYTTETSTAASVPNSAATPTPPTETTYTDDNTDTAPYPTSTTTSTPSIETNYTDGNANTAPYPTDATTPTLPSETTYTGDNTAPYPSNAESNGQQSRRRRKYQRRPSRRPRVSRRGKDRYLGYIQ